MSSARSTPSGFSIPSPAGNIASPTGSPRHVRKYTPAARQRSHPYSSPRNQPTTDGEQSKLPHPVFSGVRPSIPLASTPSSARTNDTTPRFSTPPVAPSPLPNLSRRKGRQAPSRRGMDMAVRVFFRPATNLTHFIRALCSKPEKGPKAEDDPNNMPYMRLIVLDNRRVQRRANKQAASEARGNIDMDLTDDEEDEDEDVVAPGDHFKGIFACTGKTDLSYVVYGILRADDVYVKGHGEPWTYYLRPRDLAVRLDCVLPESGKDSLELANILGTDDVQLTTYLTSETTTPEGEVRPINVVYSRASMKPLDKNVLPGAEEPVDEAGIPESIANCHEDLFYYVYPLQPAMFKKTLCSVKSMFPKNRRVMFEIIEPRHQYQERGGMSSALHPDSHFFFVISAEDSNHDSDGGMFRHVHHIVLVTEDDRTRLEQDDNPHAEREYVSALSAKKMGSTGGHLLCTFRQEYELSDIIKFLDPLKHDVEVGLNPENCRLRITYFFQHSDRMQYVCAMFQGHSADINGEPITNMMETPDGTFDPQVVPDSYIY